MRGWHTILQVDVEHLASCLLHLEELGAHNNMTVLLTGPFTSKQREKTLAKVIVRRDLVLDAVRWLSENTAGWQRVDLQKLADELHSNWKPMIIDDSHEIESTNTNVEMTEQFSVVFPNANASELNGGFKTISEFKAVLEKLQSEGGTLTV